MKIGLFLGWFLSVGILALLANSPAQVAGRNGSVSPASVTLSLPSVADVTLAAEFPDTNFQDM